jgi:glycosyltransferase involved in cell wall biosynthesis
MDSPLVSVIIPTKNSSAFLEECLVSIQKQTYQNREIVIVDNHSFDNTKEIAQKFTDKVYTRGPERSAQRNFAVNQCSGEYVIIIDSDMILSSRVLHSCIEKMRGDATIAGVIIPEESFGVGFWAQCKKLERSFYVDVAWMEGARFFKKSTYETLGGYDETMISGEDWDFSQRVEGEGKIARISEFIYHNEGKISLSKTIKKKFYYAQKFALYLKKNKEVEKTKHQVGLIKRYLLFFSDPRKLLRNPIVGVGMLFMKSCEFFFGGMGYLIAGIKIKI